ncbi:MAG TPA: hypothetical protein VFG53_09375 [Anaeromyxobacter sp.]|nr:hypothetical protein [Anaeromyxobacter sp.]
MAEPTPEFLTELLGSVLEDSAFLLAEPVEERPRFEGSVLLARIAFESMRGGTLRLLTTPEAATEIAANMLGIEPGEEARSSGRAAVSELLNVLGGSFLIRYFGAAVPSQLGLPTSEVLSDWPGAPLSCAAAVRLESGAPLVLELDLEER